MLVFGSTLICHRPSASLCIPMHPYARRSAATTVSIMYRRSTLSSGMAGWRCRRRESAPTSLSIRTSRTLIPQIVIQIHSRSEHHAAGPFLVTRLVRCCALQWESHADGAARCGQEESRDAFGNAGPADEKGVCNQPKPNQAHPAQVCLVPEEVLSKTSNHACGAQQDI